MTSWAAARFPRSARPRLDRDTAPDIAEGEGSNAEVAPSLDALPLVDQASYQPAEAFAEDGEPEADAAGQECEKDSAGDAAEVFASDGAVKAETPEAACADAGSGSDAAVDAPQPNGADTSRAAASAAQVAPDAKPAASAAGGASRASDPSRTDTLVLPTSNEQRRFAAEEPKPDHRRAKAVVAGLAAVLLVAAAGAGYYLSANHTEGEGDASIEPANQGRPDQRIGRRSRAAQGGRAKGR